MSDLFVMLHINDEQHIIKIDDYKAPSSPRAIYNLGNVTYTIPPAFHVAEGLNAYFASKGLDYLADIASGRSHPKPLSKKQQNTLNIYEIPKNALVKAKITYKDGFVETPAVSPLNLIVELAKLTEKVIRYGTLYPSCIDLNGTGIYLGAEVMAIDAADEVWLDPLNLNDYLDGDESAIIDALPQDYTWELGFYLNNLEQTYSSPDGEHKILGTLDSTNGRDLVKLDIIFENVSTPDLTINSDDTTAENKMNLFKFSQNSVGIESDLNYRFTTGSNGSSPDPWSDGSGSFDSLVPNTINITGRSGVVSIKRTTPKNTTPQIIGVRSSNLLNDGLLTTMVCDFDSNKTYFTEEIVTAPV